MCSVVKMECHFKQEQASLVEQESTYVTLAPTLVIDSEMNSTEISDGQPFICEGDLHFAICKS